MKIIMRAAISGTRDGEPWPAPGSVVDLPAAEAVDLLNVGMAEPAGESVEAAVAGRPSEKATRRRSATAKG